MNTWSDVTDPSGTWSDASGDPPHRHTYGMEYGKTTRVVYGDNLRFGGLGFDDASGDPTTSGTDVTDPSNTWSDTIDPSDTWTDN